MDDDLLATQADAQFASLTRFLDQLIHHIAATRHDIVGAQVTSTIELHYLAKIDPCVLDFQQARLAQDIHQIVDR